MSERYRHYYGYCEDDNVIVQVEVGPDGGPAAKLPPDEEWESFGLTCPVCSNTVPGGFDGADDVTTEDQLTKWMRRAHAAESNLSAVEYYATRCALNEMEPTSAGLRDALTADRTDPTATAAGDEGGGVGVNVAQEPQNRHESDEEAEVDPESTPTKSKKSQGRNYDGGVR